MINNFLKLDWLGFTFKPDIRINETPLKQFLNMFPEIDQREFVIPNKGKHYNRSLLYNDIFISYNEFDNDTTPSEYEAYYAMGVNVQVPSHCLSFFCSILGLDFQSEYCVRDLLKFLQNRKCVFSRIDVCYDDFEKKFNAFYYIKKVTDKCIASPCRKITTCISNSEVDSGSTIYFGSLSRRKKLLRIYDKYAESEGEVDSVRYEFEYHGSTCIDLVNKIFEYEGKLPFLEMLLSVCRVVDSNSTIKDLSDRETDSEWINALKGDLTLNSIIKIKNCNISNYDNPDNFVLSKVISSIAGYVEKNGYFALFEVAKKAIHEGRISPNYKNYFNKLKHCEDVFPIDNTFCDEFSFGDNPFLQY